MRSLVIFLLCVYPLPVVLFLWRIFKKLKEEFLRSHFRASNDVWYTNEIRKAFERRMR